MRGITVTLINKVQTGVDPFNEPVYEYVETEVENVLVGEPNGAPVVASDDLNGRKISYTLGIPKGDTHEWTDCKVRFWGNEYDSVGIPETGIEALVPTKWHKKVKVERYE